MSGLADIAAERQRQIDAEGWSTDHDDAHADGQLAIAGAAYAFYGGAGDKVRAFYPAGQPPLMWPWSASWW